jgi:Prokaryotic homologs of the JAB domain
MAIESLLRQLHRRVSPMKQFFIRQSRDRHNGGTDGRSSSASLRQVVFTDEVSRSLFSQYHAHRLSERGRVETGWVLLGQRHGGDAIVLAVLPAGQNADAGVGHVQFNARLQAIAARILRQKDRRLTILGIVHTHPGSLRHPSSLDLEADMTWVQQLKGGVGIFGIGTADGEGLEAYALEPRSHVQCWGRLRLSWYALDRGDHAYRPLPCRLTLGPDLARPLHQLWPVLESNAERLDCLVATQAGARFEIASDGTALVVDLPLAEANGAQHIVLKEDD